MIERQITLPADREDVWAALTDPARVAAWFGAQVEWDLRAGGAAHFATAEGRTRTGVIESVTAAKVLRFRWWPVEEDGEPASEVIYTLEDVPDGTRLTVTEQRLAPTASLRAQAAAAPTVSPWDVRMLGLAVDLELRMGARLAVCV